MNSAFPVPSRNSRKSRAAAAAVDNLETSSRQAARRDAIACAAIAVVRCSSTRSFFSFTTSSSVHAPGMFLFLRVVRTCESSERKIVSFIIHRAS